MTMLHVSATSVCWNISVNKLAVSPLESSTETLYRWVEHWVI